MADLYAPIRSGTDIAFLGGMINYLLEKDLIFKEYVVNYTDAPFLVNADFKMPGELDGVFSGYDETRAKYDRKTWGFQLDEKGVPKRDLTLQDPNCVYQLLKKHYSRYTIDTVSQITGTPKDKIEAVYQAVGSTGKPDRAGTGCYAMGWTQHTVGVQNIRAFTIVQLLLGNMGMAGGGVNALRGEGNVQGSTDHGILFHILTGYLPTPTASLVGLKDYIAKFTPTTKEPKSVNWWGNRGKYITSYLKAVYGDQATKGNDFGYAWLPKLDEGMEASWLPLFIKMHRGEFEGFFNWGMNPACSSTGAGKVREALGKLKWMVSRRPLRPRDVLLLARAGHEAGGDPDRGLPAALLLLRRKGREHLELQPPRAVALQGDRADRAVALRRRDPERAALQGEGALPEGEGRLPRPDPEAHLGVRGEGQAGEDQAPRRPEGREGDQRVLPRGRLRQEGGAAEADRQEGRPGRELREPAGRRVDLERELALLRQLLPERGKAVNMMARRGKEDPTGLGLYPNWAWAWPLNRRIIYNRASVDPNGNPWDPKRAVITWKPADPATGKPGAWEGDVPDGPAPPLANEKDGKLPFIMKPLGVGAIFGSGLGDGPFPEHYEPLESPVPGNLMSKKHRVNPTIPVAKLQAMAKDPTFLFSYDDKRFPYVATTYRVSEHWQTGVMTRHLPWLLEMQPQMFVEMDRELAADKGVKNGDMVAVTSARGQLPCVAIVTDRFKPMTVMGVKVHTLGMPWCYGWRFPEDGSGGDSVNLLTPFMGDPNTWIPESKAFMVDVSKLADRPSDQPAGKP